MSDLGTDTKSLEAKCSCGSINFTIEVAKPNLPLQTYLCHCSLCRYALGAPCIFHFNPPKGVTPRFKAPSSESDLSKYGNGQVYMCFCSTCGCHIGAVDEETGEWTLSNSIFTDHGPDNFQITRHVFSKSVKDGGIAKLLTQMSDWNPPADSPSAKLVECDPEVGKDGQERLRAECHCGGVSFTITRPTPEVLQDEFLSKFVSPRDKAKWFACLDACDDCRTVTGLHVIGWMFFPLSICEPAIKSDLMIGTSKTYKSSEDVLRSFCGHCGATLFYSCDDRRLSDDRQIVDLSTGVLRAPEGGLAENWLTWRARVAWLDDGRRYDSAFADALQEGMNKWVLETQGEILDYTI